MIEPSPAMRAEMRQMLVNGLISGYGVSREAAERAADRTYPKPVEGETKLEFVERWVRPAHEEIGEQTRKERQRVLKANAMAQLPALAMAEQETTEAWRVGETRSVLTERTEELSFLKPGKPIRRIDADEQGRLEKAIEHECDKLVRACAGRVVKFSHPGRTKQTPGIADRLYIFPRHECALWFEVKKDDGKQRPEQKVFEEDVTAGGQEYLCGGLGDLRHWLFTNDVVAGYDDDHNPILPVLWKDGKRVE